MRSTGSESQYTPYTMKMTGHTTTDVGPKTILHLDPTHPVHAKDQQLSKEKRAYLGRLAPLVNEIPIAARFRSLGNGFMMKPDGAELSSAEHQTLVSSALRARSHYWTTQQRADGRTYRRKRVTKAVKQMAALFQAKHHLALARLGVEFTFDIKPLVKAIALAVASAFSKATGYDVLAIQVHPKEGCLHFHITYATVTREGQLIHAEGRRGRHGPHFLGPALIGALRLGEYGLLAPDQFEQAKRFLADRQKCNKGTDPVDWRMSEMIDGLCEKFADSNHTIRAIFDKASQDYAASFEAGELSPRKQLVGKVTALQQEIKNKDAEIAEIHSQLEELKKVTTTSSAASAPSTDVVKEPLTQAPVPAVSKTTYKTPTITAKNAPNGRLPGNNQQPR